MAVDYVRHGIELANRTEPELTTRFSTELSRAVRAEASRNDAANKFISMHKRHGEAVARVLKQKVVERAADIASRALVPSSLLALAIGVDALGEEPKGNQRVNWVSHESVTLQRYWRSSTDWWIG